MRSRLKVKLMNSRLDGSKTISFQLWLVKAASKSSTHEGPELQWVLSYNTGEQSRRDIPGTESLRESSARILKDLRTSRSKRLYSIPSAGKWKMIINQPNQWKHRLSRFIFSRKKLEITNVLFRYHFTSTPYRLPLSLPGKPPKFDLALDGPKFNIWSRIRRICWLVGRCIFTWYLRVDLFDAGYIWLKIANISILFFNLAYASPSNMRTHNDWDQEKSEYNLSAGYVIALLVFKPLLMTNIFQLWRWCTLVPPWLRNTNSTTPLWTSVEDHFEHCTY